MPSTIILNRKPLGLALPIRNAGVGFFEQTFDTFTQTKTNILNLLKTRPGERRMQPLFGCRLYTAVFEQNLEMLPEYLTNIVKEDIYNWIPNVSVLKVDVKFSKDEESNEIDMYKVYIAIDFRVETTQQSDTIELIVNSNQP